MNTILLVPTGKGTGVTSASLGLVAAFDFKGITASFIKPFSQDPQNNIDAASALHQHLFANRKYFQPIKYQKIVKAVANNQLDDVLEEAVSQHREISQDNDVVIIGGLLPSDPFAGEVNTALAQALDAKVVLVATADLNAPEKAVAKLEEHLRHFGGLEAGRFAGVLFMRTKGFNADQAQEPLAIDPSLRLKAETEQFTKKLQEFNPVIGSDKLPVLGLVPFSETLSVPRTLDIAEAIEAQWLNQGEANKRRVLNTHLIASNVDNELAKFKAGSLLVTAGGRDDVLLASGNSSSHGVPLAGVVFAEYDVDSNKVAEFSKNPNNKGLPILHTKLSLLETTNRLTTFSSEVPSDDLERAGKVARFVASHLDDQWLETHSNPNTKARLSPSAFRYELVQNSIAAKKRIVLPEGDEPRTVKAAAICQSRGIAHCILLAKPEAVNAVAQAQGIELPSGLEIIDPDSIRERYIAPMVELRKGKLDAAQAAEQLEDTVVLGTMMLALDDVDGLVSGAVHTTANTIRPAFQLIKTAPEYSLVSSVFFMLLPEEVYVYGDCAVNPNPTAEQLAEIAIQSADSAKAFGIDPRIAMISYSTGTSGAGADVEKVAEAARIAQERRPDLLIDGPLQYDAASVESVGRSKAPNSAVAGRANVFIFPDLNTGNTTYKAVQRSANVVSVGPMLQGLNKPVNDLSRGALVDDIVFTIALTAIQAKQQEK